MINNNNCHCTHTVYRLSFIIIWILDNIILYTLCDLIKLIIITQLLYLNSMFQNFGKYSKFSW